MQTVTRDQVIAKMNREDRFAVSLLIEMFNRQTEDEQQAEATGHDNGIGFNGTDAGFLSSLAKQAIERRAQRKAGDIPSHWTDLSPRQMECLRKKLAKYGRQLTEITNAALAAREGDRLPGEVVTPPATEETPWGTRQTGMQYHPLPAHLAEKRQLTRMEVALEAEPFCALNLPEGSALVPCPGGFRFRSDRERWEEGGKSEFNQGVDRWCRDRDGNKVGGQPAFALVGDPFA